MADTKISAEAAATALGGTELFEGVQSAANVKVTAAQIKTFTSASPTLVTPALGTPASGTLTSCTGLPAVGGGTGQATYAKGDILASPGSNTLNKLGVGTDAFVLTADAASTNGIKWAAAPSGAITINSTTLTGGTSTKLLFDNAGTVGELGPGTTTTVLHGNAGGNPSFGAVNLNADCTGFLPIPVNAQTGTTYTMQTTDIAGLTTFSNGSAVAVAIPQATGSFVAANFLVENKGAGTVTFTPTTSTIDGAATLVLTTNQGCVIVSDGTNYTTMRGIGPASGSLTVGTTGIGSGTTTKVLFDNAGVLGEYTISGSGNVAMTTSPSFTTPVLGTPTSGTLTNCTGLPAVGGGTGQSTYSKGDILASPGSNTLNKLGVGTDGQVLTADAASTNGIKWAAAGGGSGLTNFASDGTTLTGSAQTITTSAPILSLSQTWNSGGVTFTGLTANFTDTASAAASLLLDLKVSTVSKFNIRKDGFVTSGAVRAVGDITPTVTGVDRIEIGVLTGDSPRAIFEHSGSVWNIDNASGTFRWYQPGTVYMNLSTTQFQIGPSSALNVVLGGGALATNATAGFLYVVSGAGTPTGTPTSFTGTVPVYIDTTNSQLWLYLAGAWKQPKTPAGAALVTWQ